MKKNARGGAAAARKRGGVFVGLLAAAVLGGFGSIVPGAVEPFGWQAAFAREPAQGYGESGRVHSTVARAQLPHEALDTLNLIAAGGPYPYPKDGAVFGNFERLLPARPRGYYHEYTVPTPRARNRGARRIVCGGPPRRTDNCFYSNDHYNSFERIVE